MSRYAPLSGAKLMSSPPRLLSLFSSSEELSSLEMLLSGVLVVDVGVSVNLSSTASIASVESVVNVIFKTESVLSPR